MNLMKKKKFLNGNKKLTIFLCFNKLIEIFVIGSKLKQLNLIFVN